MDVTELLARLRAYKAGDPPDFALACAALSRIEAQDRELAEAREQLRTSVEGGRLVLADLAEALAELRGLTPGGSEFQTSQECAAFVRQERSDRLETIKRFKRQADEARAEAERLSRLAIKNSGDALDAELRAEKAEAALAAEREKYREHLAAHNTADAHDCAEMEEAFQRERGRSELLRSLADDVADGVARRACGAHEPVTCQCSLHKLLAALRGPAAEEKP